MPLEPIEPMVKFEDRMASLLSDTLPDWATLPIKMMTSENLTGTAGLGRLVEWTKGELVMSGPHKNGVKDSVLSLCSTLYLHGFIHPIQAWMGTSNRWKLHIYKRARVIIRAKYVQYDIDKFGAREMVIGDVVRLPEYTQNDIIRFRELLVRFTGQEFSGCDLTTAIGKLDFLLKDYKLDPHKASGELWSALSQEFCLYGPTSAESTEFWRRVYEEFPVTIDDVIKEEET
jgi:hypothetical protein